MSGLVSTISAIGMIAAFALVVGGIRLIRRKDRGRGVLMLIAAAVLVGNVVILTI